jgi:hypothetical protein
MLKSAHKSGVQGNGVSPTLCCDGGRGGHPQGAPRHLPSTPVPTAPSGEPVEAGVEWRRMGGPLRVPFLPTRPCFSKEPANHPTAEDGPAAVAQGSPVVAADSSAVAEGNPAVAADSPAAAYIVHIAERQEA